jgi:imidazolonepropionase-like amidohydrolase
MRAYVAAAVCVVSAALAPHSMASDSLLISAEKLYPAPDVPALTNARVLIRDGRIASVSSDHATLNTPAGTKTLPCKGVVMAGFQNSHVHFTEEVWSNASNQPADALESRLTQMLTRYGFTTVFDTGSDLTNTVALRRRVAEGAVKGPRVLTVGLPLYPPDGIPVYIRDLPADVLARMHQPRSAEEARAAVRSNLAAGADGTKLFMVTSPTWGTFKHLSLDVAKAAVEETHRQGKLVMAHPGTVEGIRTALAAGVDVLVHTTLGENIPWDEKLTGQMVTQHMSVMPTFKLWTYELNKAKVPANILERLVTATHAELRAFQRAGGQVLFGTDVGYMHDYDPTDEYVSMAQAGLSVKEILAALTTAPAARWKESDRRGRIQPGMDADLVVLAADPADDVRHFGKVRCVVRAGKLIHTAEGQ